MSMQTHMRMRKTGTNQRGEERYQKESFVCPRGGGAVQYQCEMHDDGCDAELRLSRTVPNLHTSVRSLPCLFTGRAANYPRIENEGRVFSHRYPHVSEASSPFLVSVKMIAFILIEAPSSTIGRNIANCLHDWLS